MFVIDFGNVSISGGAVLTNTTDLPADQTTIYITAGNASNTGVKVGVLPLRD
jgi:hypothetical protein